MSTQQSQEKEALQPKVAQQRQATLEELALVVDDMHEDHNDQMITLLSNQSSCKESWKEEFEKAKIQALTEMEPRTAKSVNLAIRGETRKEQVFDRQLEREKEKYKATCNEASQLARKLRQKIDSDHKSAITSKQFEMNKKKKMELIKAEVKAANQARAKTNEKLNELKKKEKAEAKEREAEKAEKMRTLLSNLKRNIQKEHERRTKQKQEVRDLKRKKAELDPSKLMTDSQAAKGMEIIITRSPQPSRSPSPVPTKKSRYTKKYMEQKLSERVHEKSKAVPSDSEQYDDPTKIVILEFPKKTRSLSPPPAKQPKMRPEEMKITINNSPDKSRSPSPFSAQLPKMKSIVVVPDSTKKYLEEIEKKKKR